MRNEKISFMIEKILYLFLFALPLLGGGNYLFDLSPLWGSAILFLTVSLFLLFLIFLTPKHYKLLCLRWSDGLLSAFGIVTVLSYYYSKSRVDSLIPLLVFLGSVSLAFWVRLCMSDIHSIERIAKMILFSTLGVMMYEFYQSFWQFGTIARTISLETGQKELIQHFRLYRTPFSTFMTSNNLACYLVMVFPICLYFLIKDEKESRHFKWTFLLGFISLALFMTASKGGIFTCLCLILALIIFIYKYDKDGFRPFLKRMSFSIAGALILTAILWNVAWKPEGQNSIKNEISMFSVTPEKIESSSTGRIHYWKTAYQMWKEHWFIGSGIGTYPVLNSKYQESVYYSKHAHNDYLEIMAESGVAGLFFFIASIASLFMLAIKALQAIFRKSGEEPLTEQAFQETLLGSTLILSLSGFLIHSAIDFNWEIPANKGLFLILLMMLSSLISIIFSSNPEGNKNLVKVETGNRVGKILVISLFTIQWLWMPQATIAQSYFELASDPFVTDRSKAVSFAEEASALYPAHYRYHLFLAKAFKENWLSASNPEDLKRALTEGETAVSLQPEIAENHGEVAAILNLKGEHLMAEKEWKLAIKLGKKQLKNYNQLGEYYLEQKDFQNARTILMQGFVLAKNYREAQQIEMKNEVLKNDFLLGRLEERIRG